MVEYPDCEELLLPERFALDEYPDVRYGSKEKPIKSCFPVCQPLIGTENWKTEI